MSITREQISDLTSHISRMIQAELLKQRADWELDEAKRKFANYLNEIEEKK